MSSTVLNKFNYKLMVFLAFWHLIATIVTPVVLIATNNIYFSLLFIPSLLLTNTTWALIHEGIHSNFNNNPRYNNLYSRFLSILLHSNFEVLRFGHLMHHRYNRTDLDLTEGCDSRAPNQNKLSYGLYKLGQNLLYYFHITIGLYLAELIGPILFLLPKSFILNTTKKLLGTEHEYIANGKKILLKPERFKKIRIDSILNVAIFIMVIFLYQSYIVFYIGFLLIRALLISSADNLPHYSSGRDKITGSFNLFAPKWFERCILNFNYHRVHHKHPNVPWHLLPTKFTEDKEHFDINYFRQYAKQWGGVITKDKLT